MLTIEYELTYLAKRLPFDLQNYPSRTITDNYYPADGSSHPNLRLRQNDKIYEITKKTPVNANDFSRHHEHTLSLTRQEYDSLVIAPGLRVSKRRYYYTYKGMAAEIDVFTENLEGLVLIDFEFKDSQAQAEFKAPSFCLADVTQEPAIAGGVLAGKSFSDLAIILDRYGYSRVSSR